VTFHIDRLPAMLHKWYRAGIACEQQLPRVYGSHISDSRGEWRGRSKMQTPTCKGKYCVVARSFDRHRDDVYLEQRVQTNAKSSCGFMA
jgi:hypothetical protein